MPNASEPERQCIVCALQNQNEKQLAVLINLKQINPPYADDTSANRKTLPLHPQIERQCLCGSEASGMR